jgi:hypothetical protein
MHTSVDLDTMEENLLPLPAIESHFLSYSACNLIITSTFLIEFTMNSKNMGMDPNNKQIP